MPSVNVSGVREARLAATALRAVEPELRKAINADTRAVVNPLWRDAIASRATSRLDQRVLGRGARVATGARPALVAASSRRALRGGLEPASEWPVVEFGAKDRNARSTYSRRTRSGKTAKVTRRTRRQLPAHRRSGRVLYPAAAEVLPRVSARWAQTAIWLTFEALRKGDR